MTVPFELDNLRVVLVRTRNPLNIGAAARAISNFGFQHLRLVTPYEVAFRRARSAVGASSVLTGAEEFKSVADAVADCTLVVGTTAVRHRELNHSLRRLEQGGRLIRKELARSRVALLMGSEKVGLSNADLSHCHWIMRIPTHEANISMNLGQAVAVCLYELIRDGRVPTSAASGEIRKQKARERPGPEKRKSMDQNAAAAELERITTALFEILRATRYWNPGAGASTEEKVRRLVRRLRIHSGDADVLLGILRQIMWKIRSTDKA